MKNARPRIAGPARGWILVWSLLAALAFALPLWAHTGEWVYPIYELPTSQLPDLHDGTLDDWDSRLPEAAFDVRDFTSRPAGLGFVDSADMALRGYLAWHNASQRIYLGIELVDDVYLNDYPGSQPELIPLYDHLVISLDGDHSGGRFFLDPFERIRENDRLLFDFSQAQQYRVLARSPDGLLARSLSAAGVWTDHPPYTDAGGWTFGSAPSQALVELYLTPWNILDWQNEADSQRSRLAPGDIIGFDIQFLDYDSEAGRLQGHFGLGVLPINRSLTPVGADLFVDGLLVPCQVEDCSMTEESAVAPNTWAHIKASFR
ncbi:MAG: hypothetical protein GKR89_03195 [Candidatus Latescibacteria bacterium]|nr:hypothetical protein [Candidatus Latescibacterota bacterium]